MIKVIDSNSDKNKFNQLAKHPLQAWEWGEARKEMSIEILRLEDGNNVFQISFHKIPHTNYKIGYLPRSVLPTKELLLFLSEYGKQNRIIFFKIEPYALNSKFEIRNSKFLLKSPHPLFPNWTQILDITSSDDQLLKNMHPKTRYNIRLAEKKEVLVKEMSNDKGFEIFANLYFQTTKRQKYLGHDYRYHKIVWANLKAKISHLLIAFYKDVPLAAYQLFYFKDTFYYVYGGTSELHRNFMASNLLMWEAIKLGKSLGAKQLDMWGSLPPNYSHHNPWAGFTRFKEGYGGKFVEFIGSYDLIINNPLYHFYNFAFKLRRLYLQMRNY